MMVGGGVSSDGRNNLGFDHKPCAQATTPHSLRTAGFETILALVVEDVVLPRPPQEPARSFLPRDAGPFFHRVKGTAAISLR